MFLFVRNDMIDERKRIWAQYIKILVFEAIIKAYNSSRISSQFIRQISVLFFVFVPVIECRL